MCRTPLYESIFRKLIRFHVPGKVLYRRLNSLAFEGNRIAYLLILSLRITNSSSHLAFQLHRVRECRL